ncbi:hypothetical protein Tco_0725624 [Tanacetum coccineum]|uniref:Uncharacterized protein n=1 Tax=Tanacetum coccineum TaxID=301880 RepID=A0ABQ4YEV2_9ASTR
MSKTIAKRSLLHDNIVPKPDLALELGKSISLTEAEEEAVAREGHATHARIMSGPDPEPMQEDQTGSNYGKLHVSLVGPNPEHMDDEFLATAYPKVHENLKLITDERVIEENPESHSGSICSYSKPVVTGQSSTNQHGRYNNHHISPESLIHRPSAKKWQDWEQGDFYQSLSRIKESEKSPKDDYHNSKMEQALIADEDAMDKEVTVKGRSGKRKRPGSATSGLAQPPSKDDHQSSKKPWESDSSASKQHPALTSTGWQITNTRDDVVNSLMHMLPNNIQITDTNSFIVSKKRSSNSSKKLKGIQTLTPAEQEAADIMKALKESKKMSKRQPGTGGSNEGICHRSLFSKKLAFPPCQESFITTFTTNIRTTTEQFIPPSKKDYDVHVRIPLFNEYYNLPPRTVSPDPVCILLLQSLLDPDGPVPQFMAPDHSSSGPVLHEMMSDHNSSVLAPQRQEMSVENVSSGLVPQGQKASDYDNSDPVPPRQNVVPTAEKTD